MKKIVFIALLALMAVPSLMFAEQSGTSLSVLCTNTYSFTANMTVGSTDASTGGQVSKLQNYLVLKGNLVMPAGVSTGYFGTLTRTALASFQSSAGISPAAGYFGPITRAKIQTLPCLDQHSLPGIPTSTPAPVSVSSLSPSSASIGAQVTVNGSGFTATGNAVKMDSLSLGNFNSTNGQTIVFTLPAWAGVYCAPQTACPALAVAVASGPHQLSVINSNGTSNSVSFTVLSSTATSTPVISNVSGPSTLSTNQAGTWVVSASDPQNKQLSYSVDWGDSQCSSGSGCTTSGSNTSSSFSFQQSASFTHSYSQVGVYTQTFTVKNTDGGQKVATTSVQIGNVAASVVPHLNSLFPTSGAIGTQVTITGSNFTSAGNLIKLGDSADINVRSADGITLKFIVPGNVSTCGSESCTNVYQPITSGSYQITVTNSKGNSNSIMFSVTSS